MPSPLEVLAEEIGAVAGRIERESGLRIKAALADLQRIDAERELRFRDLEQRIAERLASLKDGEPGRDGIDGKDGQDGASGNDGIDGNDGLPGDPGQDGLPGQDGQAGRDGIDCDMERIHELVDALVAERVAALPPPEKGDPGGPGRDGVDGKDGRDGQDITDIEAAIIDASTFEISFTIGEAKHTFELELPCGADGKDGAPGEKGDPGPAGSLPAVEAWFTGVHYAGNIRSHAGGTWQALKDTASEPPHDDWICIAAPGLNGQDGKSFNPRGLYVAEEEYRSLDVVANNGNSFVAVKDAPGPLPGEGWKLLAQKGKPGEKGERGMRGDPGPAGPSISKASIDDQGLQTFFNADGSQVQCDLYPVLSRLK